MTSTTKAPKAKKNTPPALAREAKLLPLCIDLDGTLVRSDHFVESLVAGVGNWQVWRALLTLFNGGRAGLKREMARIAPIDAASLPYNEELIAYLREEKARGRKIYLTTAADIGIAQAVSDHLQLFDGVIASDGVRNLKGAHKADALVERFGERGFVYAGNDRSDLKVWRKSDAAIVVNATRATAAEAARITKIEKQIGSNGSPARSIVRALRPHQWVKNLLVLVPVATSHSLSDESAWIGAAWIFAAFCSTASGIYIINDLSDLKADRRHHRKKNRPFASGALSPLTGLLMSMALLTAGVVFGTLSGALALIGVYATISLSYSIWLKEFPLVDIFILAGLYTLRLFAGGEATGHPVSLWLLGFSSFFFLSLALVKRVSELMVIEGQTVLRRGYVATDAPVLQLMGIASGFTSVVVLSQFVQDEAISQMYASPAILWCTVPLILFWLCRIWLSTARGYMHDDPIVYAAKDWVSWLVSLAVFGALAAAKTVTL